MRKFCFLVLLLSSGATSHLSAQDSSIRSYTIAFLLPFNASKAYVRDLEQGDFYLPGETQIAVEFYQGAMLAIDSLKKMGLNATVLVFDTGNDSATVTAVLAKPQLKTANLIFGPLSGYALKAACNFSANQHIPLVSPLLAAYPSADSNQFFILANATIRTHCEALYDYLLKNEFMHRTIMLYKKTPADLELVDYIKKYRDKKTYSGYQELKFIELTDSTKTTFNKLRDSLFMTDKNILIIPSSNESFVRSVMKQVTNLKPDYDIEVYGMPTWINFDLVPAENLDSARAIITSSFWLDKSLPSSERFKAAYTGKYNMDPTEYSVRGCDEMFYFGSHLMRMGTRLFLSVFPPGMGLTSATFFNVVPLMKEERVVMYRENKSVFFLQRANGQWMKKQ